MHIFLGMVFQTQQDKQGGFRPPNESDNDDGGRIDEGSDC